MDRRTLLVALLAGLAVLAIGLTASTLETYDRPDGGGLGDGGDAPFAIEPPTDEGPADSVGSSALVRAVFLALLALFAIGLVVVVLEEGVVRYLPTIAVLVAVVAAMFLLLHLVDFELPAVEPPDPGALAGEGEPSAGEGSGTGPESDAFDLPPVLVQVLAALGVLVLLAGLVLTVRSRGTDSGETAPAEEDSAGSDAVSRAAGRAADRLEAAGDRSDDGLENEVYRAWEEMTEPLDVASPETSTPGEFATAAIDAGVSERDVRELTRLFEDVRYGGRAPTESREEQAVRCFRRIEANYDREDG